MAGFIRYKLDNLTTGNNTVSITIAGTTYSKTVRIKPFCTGGIYLKYLDKNGQYRFYPFSKYYDVSETPKSLGSTNNTINELISAQGRNKEIGYSNTKILSAIAISVPVDEMLLLADLYISPRVYLHDNSANDGIENWTLVKIKPLNPLSKKAKGGFSDIQIDIELPESYTLTML